MRYQLVLQWPSSSIKDLDDLIGIEDTLSEKMSEENEVDGHDAGVGEMNIFIQTEDPKKAFDEIKHILGSKDFWIDARVAYREITGSNYTAIWPENLTSFKVK